MECYQIKNLSFKYPDSDRMALDNISFTVNKGEFIIVCGLSGSGKSTLLRHLKPSLQPHGTRSGLLHYSGDPIESLSIRQQAGEIGFVTQSPDNQSITDRVWHELVFGMENLGFSQKDIQKRASETASFFGIEKWFDKAVDELSGGQKQILNLASVMVLQPSVLILDEPTSQLDPIACSEFIAMLKKINSELGVTIILSEHHLNEIFTVSSRVIVMSDGKIVADDRPDVIPCILYKRKDPVFLSVPVPARLFSYLEENKKQVPMTVSEGRDWLTAFCREHTFNETELTDTANKKTEPIIKLKKLWFRYDRAGDDVLKDLELNVYPGEILTILGGNGAGKTTLLSLISGVLQPYRGSVYLNGKKARSISDKKIRIALLPQNPQALFVHKTVLEDLEEMLDISSEADKNKNQEELRKVIGLCRLEKLLDRHPYDLSGGEQQRAAIAKLLLTKPGVLLLDEPTKGLDCAFQSELARILNMLASQGTAVVMVSHDIEFSALFSHKCAMLFHGGIVCIDTPKRFFYGNSFYTTCVCRMTRDIIRYTVTVDDVLKAFSAGEEKDRFGHDDTKDFRNIIDNEKKERVKNNVRSCKHEKKRTPFKKAVSLCLFLLMNFFLFNTAGLIKPDFMGNNSGISYILLFFSEMLFFLSLGGKRKSIRIERRKPEWKRRMISIIVILIAVPLTVAAGVFVFDESKYLFISLLIMFESVVPFYVWFEKRSIQARELVLISVICAMCVAGRALFYMLPEFKPVTALIIISASSLGSEFGFLIGSVTMLVSNIFFGQGIWTPWQMFTMGLIGFLSGSVFRLRFVPLNRVTLAIFGFSAAYIIYGGIMNPAALLLSRTPVTAESLISVYSFGLPVDTVHAVSTAVFLYLGAEPIIEKLERIKRKYGILV